ncbi:MAG: thiol-disulfide oxidoreductase DCC family protein [Ilumatobacteraceae bacterium]
MVEISGDATAGGETLRSATSGRAPNSDTARRLPMLVMDGDCAFCQASVERGRRLIGRFPTVASWQSLDASGGLQALGLDVAACSEAVQYIALDRRIHAGHDAVSALLLAAGRGWWPLGALMRVPGLRRLCGVAYRWVARNRHRLPGGSDRCSLSSAASSSSDR